MKIEFSPTAKDNLKWYLDVYEKFLLNPDHKPSVKGYSAMHKLLNNSISQEDYNIICNNTTARAMDMVINNIGVDTEILKADPYYIDKKVISFVAEMKEQAADIYG